MKQNIWIATEMHQLVDQGAGGGTGNVVADAAACSPMRRRRRRRAPPGPGPQTAELWDELLGRK